MAGRRAFMPPIRKTEIANRPFQPIFAVDCRFCWWRLFCPRQTSDTQRALLLSRRVNVSRGEYSHLDGGPYGHRYC
jgi:hypothetical protein